MICKAERILVTGSGGFVGKRVVNFLQKESACFLQYARDEAPTDSNFITLDQLTGVSIDVVIHLAGRAHILNGSGPDAYAAFRESNVEQTIKIAKAAVAAGAKRFIFISSIGVNGTSSQRPFSVSDLPEPVEDYALSKLQAENELKQIAAATGLELVVIRPPLVYGPQAPGNFGRLLNLAQKNLPLPLGTIDNKRSLVALDNLVDLIITCIDHPNAANQTFLVSDDRDLSTTELLQLLARAAGKKPRLLPVPVSWLKLAATLTGRRAVIDRLCGNLQVDISHTKQTLGWQPPITVEEGIKRCFTAGDEPLKRQ